MVLGASRGMERAEVANQSFLKGNPSRWRAGLAWRAHGAKGGAAIRREEERGWVKCPQGQCDSELRCALVVLSTPLGLPLGFSRRFVSSEGQNLSKGSLEAFMSSRAG